jgi:hypothetical protein
VDETETEYSPPELDVDESDRVPDLLVLLNKFKLFWIPSRKDFPAEEVTREEVCHRPQL